MFNRKAFVVFSFYYEGILSRSQWMGSAWNSKIDEWAMFKKYLYTIYQTMFVETEDWRKFLFWSSFFSEPRTKNMLKVIKNKGFVWPVNIGLKIGQSLAISSLVNWVNKIFQEYNRKFFFSDHRIRFLASSLNRFTHIFTRHWVMENSSFFPFSESHHV